MSARFDSGAGAWAASAPLSTDGREPRVASDAAGAVLVVYVAGWSAHNILGASSTPRVAPGNRKQ